MRVASGLQTHSENDGRRRRRLRNDEAHWRYRITCLGKFTTFSAADGLRSNRILAISEDRDVVLWVATYYRGVYRMRNGRFELLQNEILRSHEDVRAIHQNPQGTMWFGTSQGLLRYKDRSWSVITAKDGLASNDARVIIDGRAGNLWIGGYGGLTSLYHGQFKHWTEADGLPSNTIRSLYEDRDGVLWIGSYDGGLARLQDGRFTRYTLRDRSTSRSRLLLPDPDRSDRCFDRVGRPPSKSTETACLRTRYRPWPSVGSQTLPS